MHDLKSLCQRLLSTNEVREFSVEFFRKIQLNLFIGIIR
ncbi:MAG: hypothetical protein ACJARD_000779 [Alphaproteobacteria bacterium]|jgi:hypothetical protein